MNDLPDDVTSYSKTPVFDEQSVPAALLKDHETKAGTWGVIHVLEGELSYKVCGNDPAVTLRPNLPGIIAPKTLHFVEPLGPVRFFVEFFR